MMWIPKVGTRVQLLAAFSRKGEGKVIATTGGTYIRVFWDSGRITTEYVNQIEKVS